jgi:hypothetical protein
MAKFEIAIEEHIVEAFEIEAKDMDEAIEIAKKKYKDGEIVLCPGEVQAKLMSAYDLETEEGTEWFEF